MIPQGYDPNQHQAPQPTNPPPAQAVENNWQQPNDQNAPLNSERVGINQKIVDEVIAETKEGFNDTLYPLPPITLSFTNVNIWAKMKHRTGLCKTRKLLFTI